MKWRPPGGVLGELVAAARQDCEARRRARPGLPQQLARRARPPETRFRAALAKKELPTYPLICEVKRASPSAGPLRGPTEVAAVVRSYVEAGARCVSILTEERRFGGSLEDLKIARGATAVPLLRKDFMVDSYMVYEAVDAGADCILLIAAAVEPTLLLELASAADELGLDVLLELLHERDLATLELRDWPLVGINARDLETLHVDPRRFGALAPEARGPGRLLIAESGMRNRQDLARVKSQGADAALIGEALMRSDNPAALIRELLEPDPREP